MGADVDSKIIDLRSDALTRPTDGMWEAMRLARLGWATAGEDPSVNRLEAVAVELTRKDAAVFVPTGTMANLAALMTYAEMPAGPERADSWKSERHSGGQIITEESSHILWSEEWSYASICGLAARALAGREGAMDPDGVRAAICDRRFTHSPRTAVICLENTHNASGGAVLSVSHLEAIAAVAREYGIPVHLDGARLCNACMALGVEICDMAAQVNSLMIGLNKGLSAPGGAVLCGSTTFVERARGNLRRLGATSIPQAGILAAAGLVALETMAPRLADDHRRARALADGLAIIPGIAVVPVTIRTNIVMLTVDPALISAAALAERLDVQGVRGYVYSADTLRFVTHRHVDDADVQRVVEVVRCSMS